MADHHVSLELDDDRVGAVGQPQQLIRRCDTNQASPNGDCIACGAVEGEACLLRKAEAA